MDSVFFIESMADNKYSDMLAKVDEPFSETMTEL